MGWPAVPKADWVQVNVLVSREIAEWLREESERREVGRGAVVLE